MNELLMLAQLKMAQEPVVAAAEGSTESVWRQFVVSGGWITWFILIPLSVMMVALAVHYLITIRRATETPASLARALVAAARHGQVRNILEITREDGTMLGQAAHAGVSQLAAGRDAARAAIDEAVEERVTKLFRKIEYLNVIGYVSPMIGLFGTVVGMIQAFGRIFAAAGGMPDAAKLAGDISVALVTTFWGLLIAIPALSVYALFRNRIDGYAAESVRLCDDLVAAVAQQRTSSALVAPAPSLGAAAPPGLGPGLAPAGPPAPKAPSGFVGPSTPTSLGH